MKDGIRQETMCFANEYEMAWYLDDLRRKIHVGKHTALKRLTMEFILLSDIPRKELGDD